MTCDVDERLEVTEDGEVWFDDMCPIGFDYGTGSYEFEVAPWRLMESHELEPDNVRQLLRLYPAILEWAKAKGLRPTISRVYWDEDRGDWDDLRDLVKDLIGKWPSVTDAVHDDLPGWFRVGAMLLFRGCDPVYEVSSIDRDEGSWIAVGEGGHGKYPLDEVATHWGPA